MLYAKKSNVGWELNRGCTGRSVGLVFERVSEIHVNNVMGPLQVDAKKEKKLCVPSQKIDP